MNVFQRICAFALILFCSVSVCAGVNALETADVAAVIQKTALQLKDSPVSSLKRVGQSCEEFLLEYGARNACIRFLSEKKDFSNRGFFDPGSNSIYVRKDLSEDELSLTIVHEITHYQQNTRDALAFRIITSTNQKNPAQSAQVLQMESEAFSNSLEYYNNYLAKVSGDLLDEYRRSKNGTRQTPLPEWQRTLAIYSLSKDSSKEQKFLSILYE